MVTGGTGPEFDNLDSVELLNMDGTWNCALPPLPTNLLFHSQSGLVVCGGGSHTGIRKSCFTLSSDWNKTHTLAEGRAYHSSWASPKGIILIGGSDAGYRGKYRTKTEILTEDGDTITGFTPDYKTK